MSKCPKCGEEIEDQFDSCWKCSNSPKDPVSATPSRLKPVNYLTAAVVAYLIPWLAGCIESFMTHSTILPRRDEILPTFAWMMVPGVINFLILLPFLKSPVVSRLIAALLLVSWILFFFAMIGIAREK